MKRLEPNQVIMIEALYYDYEIDTLIRYIDKLCEYNYKQGMTLQNTNNAI